MRLNGIPDSGLRRVAQNQEPLEELFSLRSGIAEAASSCLEEWAESEEWEDEGLWDYDYDYREGACDQIAARVVEFLENHGFRGISVEGAPGSGHAWSTVEKGGRAFVVNIAADSYEEKVGAHEWVRTADYILPEEVEIWEVK